MIKKKTFVVVINDIALSTTINNKLAEIYNVNNFSRLWNALDYIYNSLPDMLISEMSLDGIDMIKELKNDPIFGQMPVLAIVEDEYCFSDENWMIIDDYIRKSNVDKEISNVVKLCLTRAERVVETNPLTRLPGNITIEKKIQDMIDRGEKFAVAYTDLDYFKPYNDKYGFSRGDEVLRMLGRLVLNFVRQWQPQGSFVGHIGGDDFVFIVSIDIVEKLSQEIIDTFGKIVLTFYDDEDKVKRCIDSVDREGVKKKFPIMGLSIGIAHNQFKNFTHYGEVAELASDMKKYAKLSGGSCYKIDMRK
ncbi:MAG: diguanylate cyclase [Thermodesulfovibrionales bacterium]|nr:diguanylate cyclase [Thermodesulfovibrionales bacterium]